MYIEKTKTELKRNNAISGSGKCFIGLTLLAVLILLLSVRVAGSSVHESNCEQAELFRKAAPGIIRETLEGHLFSNSGIMLTASFENEYVTGFTVMISNENFGKLNDISKQVLSSELQKVMIDTWDSCEISESEDGNASNVNEYPEFAVIIN